MLRSWEWRRKERKDNMSKILYGSQTYPWQMNVEKYHGQVPHMVEVLKQAGFTGIEAEIVMLG